MNIRAPWLLVAVAAAAPGCINGVSSDLPDEQDRQDAASAVGCAAASLWSAGTTYAAGQLVQYAGGAYRCLQAHTSQAAQAPDALLALWAPVACADAGARADAASGASRDASGSSGGDFGSDAKAGDELDAGSIGGDAGSGGVDAGGACDPSAWVYLGDDPNACEGHLGEPCGWTSTNLGQGYHCQAAKSGMVCEPGGQTCGGSGSDAGSGGADAGSIVSDAGSIVSDAGSIVSDAGSMASDAGSSGGSAVGLVFSPYKDTGIHLDWNTDVASTAFSGKLTPIGADAVAHGAKVITLAFATGECGSENWGGVPGAEMARANASLLAASGVDTIVSTGGAAGSFTCGSDAGFIAFVDRWATSHLVGVDFDIEAGQTQAVVQALVMRIKAAHARYPGLRFSLTLGTLADNDGASAARSLGATAPDSLNVYGDWALTAVREQFDSEWPSYVTVNLMTMDYGEASPGVCVVSGGVCDMGQSALQAAYNCHDHWGVPWGNLELTAMIGGNDNPSERFTLDDVDAVAAFAKKVSLAGVHYWSYDRDTDCPPGAASATCNSLGGAGDYGFLTRFLDDGL